MIPAVLAAALTAQAKVSLPPIFNNDMVIQRSTNAPIWGWAEVGEKVTVTSSWGASATVTTCEQGEWKLNLETPSAGGPHTIKIQGENLITLDNVLSGDVWVCSGQSNMAEPLQKTYSAEEEIAQADFPELRQFTVKPSSSDHEKEDYRGAWSVCSPSNAGNFTAVGYYFGKYIYLDQKIPIGLINASWGGTRIDPWTPRIGLELEAELKGVVEELDRMDPTSELGNQVFAKYVAELKEWLPGAEASLAAGLPLSPMPDEPDWRRTGQSRHQNPTFIYNSMIAPILPCAIKGVIWYQGESNSGEVRELYAAKMRALIHGWRSVWGQGDFPFYIVQLASYSRSDRSNAAGGGGFTRARQAQLDSLSIPNTGLAVTIDIGDASNVHPRNKRDVGKRLARWALARDYGKDILVSGPLYKNLEVSGDKAILSFDFTGSGLMIGKKEGMEPVQEFADSKIEWFAISGADNRWYYADSVILGNTVVVSSPKVPNPIAVRYAYTANPEGALLYNREGLPASPFTTE